MLLKSAVKADKLPLETETVVSAATKLNDSNENPLTKLPPRLTQLINVSSVINS